MTNDGSMKIIACHIPTLFRTHVTFYLDDGRYVGIPIHLIPQLNIDDLEKRSNFKISEDGQKVTWEKLDFCFTLSRILSE